jgi:hypothetical protein
MPDSPYAYPSTSQVPADQQIQRAAQKEFLDAQHAQSVAANQKQFLDAQHAQDTGDTSQ